MPLSIFLSFIRCPSIISFESPKRSYSNGFTVHEWREQQKMEEAAGFVRRSDNILIPWHFCDLCTIGIGPDHEHQKIYLYPVYREKIGLHGERKRMTEVDILCICESCASWRERRLPEWLCVLGPWAWQTNALIRQEKEELAPVPQDDGSLRAKLRVQAMKYIEACGWYVVALTAFSLNISLSTLFQHLGLKEEKRDIATQQKKEGIRSIKDPGILLRQA